MPALGEKEWQEHAALIGVVSLAWNQTVHQLLRVFCHLTGLESPLAEAIFFSPQSDSVQRNLSACGYWKAPISTRSPRTAPPVSR